MLQRVSAAAVLRCCRLLLPALCVSMFLTVRTVPAQERSPGSRAWKLRITPHWFGDDQFCWYRNDLSEGRREFILVSTADGSRQPAFDHAMLTDALRNAGVRDIDAERLPIESVAFARDAMSLEFRCAEKVWRWDREHNTLTELAEFSAGETRTGTDPQSVPRVSRNTGGETSITFTNRLDRDVELFWIDTAGERRSYGTIAAGRSHDQHTYAGHVWEAVADAETVGRFVGTDNHFVAVIDGTHVPPFEPDRRGGRDRDRRSANRSTDTASPDGRFLLRIHDHNLVLVSREGGEEQPLTTDGTSDRPYGIASWSPDSRRIAAFRMTPGEALQVHLIESSPPGGGRAVLHSREYALPGDRFTSWKMHLFDSESATAIPVETEEFDFGTPRVRWTTTGCTFTVEKTDRGHQRFRVIRVDAETGSVCNVIDEVSETFIWTAHTEQSGARAVTWLESSDELIYASERDGWRHLYLVDATAGEVIRQITRGEWLVRGIERIDEERRQIWFTAGGMVEGEDPYFLHHCRVDFDGSNLVRLTEGNGTHSVQYSPGGRFLIDTWSRVDAAPQHALRRTEDGSQVCHLESADISDLEAGGWRPPRVFSAKGRDGRTDIWGFIVWPENFVPGRSYPVLEDIYAGPHSAHVPKSFSPSDRYAELTDAGFIVVKIDGMGTAHRSKAFHDVCWQNLKDAGFPDRIAWMRAAAKQFPEMDLTRVGIYGTSAGGQNAAGAVLFHPEFYHAAYAACGCHDNRLDKASWNEQWMGYPVGPQYAASSNIDNAHRLQGHLMLVVGEMDTNVPPESTLRFADALIRADKDFELIVIPGMGHSNGGRYGRRRMREFFVRHLQPDTTSSSSRP